MSSAINEARARANRKPSDRDQVVDLARVSPERVQPDGNEQLQAIDAMASEQNVSNDNRAKRWRAFDRLLYVSFAPISPAYLFNSFDPIE